MKPSFLVLCTGNSARSILAEALLRHLGGNRIDAFSAGSKPNGAVNPHALALLKEKGIAADGLRSKSWDEYTGENAPKFSAVITVCDAAAGEACPLFLGAPIKAHWGVPDPAAVTGSNAAIKQAFLDTYNVMAARCGKLIALRLETMSSNDLKLELQRIGAAT